MRVNCCRKDRSRVISHTSHGYSTYCFRCGDDSKLFVGHGTRSASEMIQHRKELEEYMAEVGDIALPYDYTQDIPREGLLWLLKGGVSRLLREHYKFGWSERMGRVVLPVYIKGALVAVQNRAVLKGQEPKYMNKVGGDSSLFWSDPAVALEDGRTDTVVLVEDILSCVRVGRVQRAVSSLGTSISYATAAEIIKHYNRVLVWYDDDKAGLNGARKAKAVLELQGAEVHLIKTDKDPKEYDNEILKSTIKNV